MITILNASKQPVAVLEDYFDDEITEAVNGAYTLKFSVYLDDDKSPYVATGNLAEVEGQWFNIVHHRRTRSDTGAVVIAVECEQVSYDLLFTMFEGGFMHTGSPFALMIAALQGTGFSVGTVEPGGLISVDLKEGVNARAVIMEIAAQCGGELHFDRFSVSLLNRRGQDRGVQFRLGKNLRGIVKDVNAQSGEVLTAYEVDVVELRTLPEFGDLEEFELGDTVQIVDEELGINEEQRIIQYTYSPRRRINSKVVIANYVRGIQDTIYRIQTTTVGKDKWMYGVKIGPSEGIVQERYDKRARSVWNADEFRMQKGDGSGSYTDALYFDPTAGEYTFTGKIVAAAIEAGTISGTDINGAVITGGEIYGTYINGAEIEGGTITGALIRTDVSGQRIEIDEDGFRSYDSGNDVRVALGINTEAGISGFVFYNSSGVYQGQVYSTENSFHIIADDELFLHGFGSVLVQGNTTFDHDVTFEGNVVFNGVVDFTNATIIGL